MQKLWSATVAAIAVPVCVGYSINSIALVLTAETRHRYDQLRYDQRTCRAQAAPEPDIAWQADSTFRLCLREKGWYAVGE